MPTERTPDPASEASRLLTERDADRAVDWLVSRIDHLDPGSLNTVPTHQATEAAQARETLTELRAALVARDAELAELREDRDKWQRLALDANGKLAVALGHENALEAEVTQLRTERDEYGAALRRLGEMNPGFAAGVVPPEQAPEETP